MSNDIRERYFHSGWDAALQEVVDIYDHQGAEAAIRWARDHSHEPSDVVSPENPHGKSPEEIERTNRWFKLALMLGKQDEFVELLATERRRAVINQELGGF